MGSGSKPREKSMPIRPSSSGVQYEGAPAGAGVGIEPVKPSAALILRLVRVDAKIASKAKVGELLALKPQGPDIAVLWSGKVLGYVAKQNIGAVRATKGKTAQIVKLKRPSAVWVSVE